MILLGRRECVNPGYFNCKFKDKEALKNVSLASEAHVPVL